MKRFHSLRVSNKKLALTRDTIRLLTSTELNSAAGGDPNGAQTPKTTRTTPACTASP